MMNVERKRGRPPGSGQARAVTPLPGLKAARIAAGMTLQQAGGIVRLTKSHYSLVEKGLVRIDVARAVALGRALNITVETMLDCTPEPKES